MISNIKIRHVIVAVALVLAFAAAAPAILAQAAGMPVDEESVDVHDVAVEMRALFEEFQNDTRRDMRQQSDELRSEIQSRYLADKADSIAWRAETIGWWWDFVALGLTFFAIVIALAGFFGYKEFKNIMVEANKATKKAQKSADKASRATSKAVDAAEKADELVKKIEDQEQKVRSIHDNMTGATRSEQSEKIEEYIQQPPELRRMISYAHSLQKVGKIKEAVMEWRAIANLTEGIDNEVATRAWFSISFLAEDFKEQISASSHAIRLNPEFAPAYNNRGAAKVALEQYDSAIPDFDKAIAIAPEYAAAYSNRGGAKKELGQYEDAVRDCDQAIRLAPEIAATYYNRGGAKVHLKRYESAIQDYDQAIRLEPKYILAYIDRGAAKARLNRFDEARSDTQIAMHFAREIGNEKLMAVISDKMREIDGLEAG